jgi:hypothetical protein
MCSHVSLSLSLFEQTQVRKKELNHGEAGSWKWQVQREERNNEAPDKGT